MLRKRKGAVQVPITWLFAFVAGGIILLFFVGLVLKIGDTSEVTLCADITEHLDTTLTGAQTSLGTTNNLSIPNLDLTFDCTGYSLPRCRQPFGVDVVFSPDAINGRSLITYALGWDMPYRATDILYLTSPANRYVFLDNNPIVGDMYNLTPSAVNSVLIDWADRDQIVKQNNFKVKVIVGVNAGMFALGITEYFDLTDDQLQVVGVMPEISNPEVYHVVFYKKAVPPPPVIPGQFTKEGEFWVAGEAALVGVVFADDSTLFNCTYLRALDRYFYVTEVYLNRAIELSTYFIGPQRCRTEYSNAQTALMAIRDSIKDHPALESSYGLVGNATELTLINERLKLFSCPTVY